MSDGTYPIQGHPVEVEMKRLAEKREVVPGSLYEPEMMRALFASMRQALHQYALDNDMGLLENEQPRISLTVAMEATAAVRPESVDTDTEEGARDWQMILSVDPDRLPPLFYVMNDPPAWAT